MDLEAIFLAEPDVAYIDVFLAMLADYHAAGEVYFQQDSVMRREDFPAYVQQLRNEAQGLGLPPGYVPQTTFWLVRHDGDRVKDILGTLRLRHRLTPALEKEGGHIGYSVRPSARNRGYGAWQLTLGLEKAKALNLTRVMVTCDEDNIASARVIEKNGGRLIGPALSSRSGKRVLRYWISLE